MTATIEDLSFLEYWNQVDAAMFRLFGIDSFSAGMEVNLIAGAQDEGDSPESFALWFGEKYGLRRLPEVP